MSLSALLLVAASMTAPANAAFTVTSGITAAASSRTNNVNFVKQWTLNSASIGDAINSINLELAGRVFVSHVSNMPNGVLGYVNVSGNTQSIVDAINVSNDDGNDNDNDDGVDSDGELKVRLGTTASTSLSGYVLTEIFLASRGIVTDFKSQRSGQIVVMDSVLVSSSTTEEVQVEASGSSAVYVSAASTAMSVRQLQLDASGTSILQFNVESVTATDELQIDAQGSSGISLLSGSVQAATLELEAQNTGTICINAKTVTASNYEGRDASRISMPNASSRYTSTGSFACQTSTLLTREPACVGSTCENSTTPGAGVVAGTAGSSPTTTTGTVAGTAGSTPTTFDSNVNASEDSYASSPPSLAGLSAVLICVASAVLL